MALVIVEPIKIRQCVYPVGIQDPAYLLKIWFIIVSSKLDSEITSLYRLLSKYFFYKY